MSDPIKTVSEAKAHLERLILDDPDFQAWNHQRTLRQLGITQQEWEMLDAIQEGHTYEDYWMEYSNTTATLLGQIIGGLTHLGEDE